MAITTRVTRAAVLPAELERVWEAVGSPARLSRWLGMDVDLDARPGGEGTARDPEGTLRRIVVEDVEPGRRLVFHWWPALPDQEHTARTPVEAGASMVEIDLEPVEGGTLVRVTETAPVSPGPMSSSPPGGGDCVAALTLASAAPRALASVLA